jgi:hypothetical protein
VKFVHYFAIFVFAVFIYVYVDGVSANRKTLNKHKKRLDEQAAKRNGKIKRRHAPRGWELVFNHSGHNISLLLQSMRTHSYTNIETKFSFKLPPNLILELRPLHGSRRLVKKTGKQEIQIGNPDFDNAYIIKTNDELLARRLLSPEIQEKILSLNQVWFKIVQQAQLKIAHGEFSMTIPYYENAHGYDTLVDITVALLEEIVSINQQG